jgi:AbrB family looped-hinge helix DNA binding protein
MRTAIDAAGRLVVPKRIRDALGLRGGDAVEIDERDGVIEIRPVAGELEVRETAEGPVAHALHLPPPLTDELVRETLEHLRR